ncbi:MAG: hypothetical protein GAK31_02491 [Stenotrophomonas maltophilia]|uniref:RDD family protein n=1 Tax=Stenotrophomonas maltophilia TaxID=40324 RepID=A0A7V8JLD2_STEMA|nr:MAG: hypothetical protein GAK31_02491 [Stenotrophomonas maltophilia]
MTEWYYAEGQQRQGPLPVEEIRQRFQRTELTLDTLVRREGMGQWAPLRQVVDELGLQTLAAASTAADQGAGIDLRGDYSAIDNGTAPLPGTGALSSSPYTAPASGAASYGHVVHAGDVVYAGFWKRVAAYLIDYVIVTVATWIIAAVVLLAVGGASGFSPGNTAGVAAQLLNVFLSLALGIGYYAGFHASAGGATPGKMAIGIKVVRANGERISFMRGVGRFFGSILSSLILCIGFVMAAFTERKQGLHDMICDTVVVDRWAFTDQPHLQCRELGAVTIAMLVLGGIGLLGLFAVMLAVVGYLAKMA